MKRLIRPPLADAQRLSEELALTLRFEWEGLCLLTLCGDNRPLCPILPAQSAVYRLRFHIPDSREDHEGWYIGETDNLYRRMNNYRNPAGRRRTTNRKVHEAIVNTNLYGGTVTLDRVVDAHGGEGNGGSLNLDRQACRRFIEDAAILATAHRQEIELLNADEAKQWAERLSMISGEADADAGWRPFRAPEYEDLYLPPAGAPDA